MLYIFRKLDEGALFRLCAKGINSLRCVTSRSLLEEYNQKFRNV